MLQIKKLSLITLFLISSILSVYRVKNVHKDEIAWDVLGYYLYLPATFIHHDPMLKDISWLKELNKERHLAGMLYMVSQNKKGEPMYFFLMGMSLFYLPFFFLGCVYANTFGYPVDGFSMPYQYFLVIGGIIYTIIGLIFLRKILLRFFSEGLTSLLMFIIVFGTNYINQLTVDNLATVNIIFMLATITLYNTIKWHENYKGIHLFVTGISITLATLVKPTEVVIFLLPLFWKVTSFDDIKQKWAKLMENKTWLFATIIICFMIVLPQMLYWYNKTGKFIYDSYVNPAVGLDYKSPHILNVLFSYRKGWLLYTPVMMFSLIGFYFLYKRNRDIFFASIIYFSAAFYLISSWTEWWYGASYSIRPLIATYPVLAICLGYFLQYISTRKLRIKVTVGILICFFIFLNQFQWWQYKHYILDPYRTTKEYYWATFLKTTITDKDRELLLVYRDFSGKMEFKDQWRYQGHILFENDFEKQGTKGNGHDSTNYFHRFNSEERTYMIWESQYGDLTQKDHIWIKVSLDARGPQNFKDSLPCLVNTMMRKIWPYRYTDVKIKLDSLPNQWYRVEALYLTPEIRSTKDRFKCFIEKHGKTSFDIDNIKLEVYERK